LTGRRSRKWDYRGELNASERLNDMATKSHVIGALWNKTSKEGKQYFSGVLTDLRGSINIAVFANDKKEDGTNQPDYRIILSREIEKDATPSDNE